MSTLLAPSPHSFLFRSNTDGISPIRPNSPYADEISAGTVHHLSPPTISSAGSYISSPSLSLSSHRLRDENTPPRTKSPSVRSASVQSQHSKHGTISPRTPKFVLASERPPLQVATAPVTPSRGPRSMPAIRQTSHVAGRERIDVGRLGLEESPAENPREHSSPLIQPEILQFSLHIADDSPGPKNDEVAETRVTQSNGNLSPAVPEKRPFRKWISTLRRRRNSNGLEESKALKQESLESRGLKPNPGMWSWRSKRGGPRASTSTASSSIGFVTAMKSATITLASTSIHPHSWRGGNLERLRSGERSSRQSGREARKSTDSQTPSLSPIMDEAAWMRSLQRRKVLEELVASEESYIADLKILVNVIFASLSERKLSAHKSAGLLKLACVDLLNLK